MGKKSSGGGNYGTPPKKAPYTNAPDNKWSYAPAQSPDWRGDMQAPDNGLQLGLAAAQGQSPDQLNQMFYGQRGGGQSSGQPTNDPNAPTAGQPSPKNTRSPLSGLMSQKSSGRPGMPGKSSGMPGAADANQRMADRQESFNEMQQGGLQGGPSWRAPQPSGQQPVAPASQEQQYANALQAFRGTRGIGTAASGMTG